jgi:two-component system, NarL family, nitrate/nitrite response regulator NarL
MKGQFVQVLVALGPGSTNGISELPVARGAAPVEKGLAAYIIETDPDRVIARFNGHDAPDVLLLDFDFPGMEGLGGIRSALDLVAERPIAVLVSPATYNVADLALAAGANAVLPLDMPPDAFHAAVLLLQAGVSFAIFDREHVLAQMRDIGTLSDREVQVLAGICKGLQNKEIAHAFQIQEVTVKMHVRSIIRKLGARNRTHAAMIARDFAIV